MRKRIEAILHPCPKFGDIEILHEHKRNGNIHFSAWKGNLQIKKDGERLYVALGRDSIIDNPKFYEENMDNWNYLLMKEEKKNVSSKTD